MQPTYTTKVIYADKACLFDYLFVILNNTVFLLSKNLTFSFDRLTVVHSKNDWKQYLSLARFMLNT